MYIKPEARNIWVYHETEQPKIIKADEFDKHLTDGWDDNPARFVKFEDIGISREKIKEDDIQEKIKAQQAVQCVSEIAKYMNSVINLDYMNKNELIEFADYQFDLKLKRQHSLKLMREKIRGLIGDNG